MRDYYSELGLARGATPEEVRRAYRTLAPKFHPDRNNTLEASARFRAINDARDILAHPDKRACYDRIGHAEWVRRSATNQLHWKTPEPQYINTSVRQASGTCSDLSDRDKKIVFAYVAVVAVCAVAYGVKWYMDKMDNKQKMKRAEEVLERRRENGSPQPNPTR